MTEPDHVKAAIAARVEQAKRLLIDLVRLKSIAGECEEAEAIHLCHNAFTAAGADCELVPLPVDLPSDPEYSFPETPLNYEGRHNLVAWVRGNGGGRSTILQSHVDVVPATDWQEAFSPREDDGHIIGRGSVDAKGCVAAIWLATATLRDISPTLAGDVQCQIVVEEEIGGNGALALIRQGYKADVAIISEGTMLAVHPSNRGALWFRIDLEGRATHMGRKHEGISAAEMAVEVMSALQKYEERLLADSIGYPGFERYEHPVQVNVGIVNAGTWPSMVPGHAVIEGGVGFLPNRSMDQVKKELTEILNTLPNRWIREHHTLSFRRIHNDSYETDFTHPAVNELSAAVAESGLSPDVLGWNVSCDARLYAKVGGMPTIVFGPGSITEAHAKDERIELSQIECAAEILVRFVLRWCGI